MFDDKQKRYINVSSDVCFNDNHSKGVFDPECDGMSIFDDDEKVIYMWSLSCSQCAGNKIKELREAS